MPEALTTSRLWRTSPSLERPERSAHAPGVVCRVALPLVGGEKNEHQRTVNSKHGKKTRKDNKDTRTKTIESNVAEVPGF